MTNVAPIQTVVVVLAPPPRLLAPLSIPITAPSTMETIILRITFSGVHIENLRFKPYRQGLLGVRGRDTTQVDGVEQNQPHVRHAYTLPCRSFEPLSKLSYELRLTDTGCTPQHHGRHVL